MSIQWNDREDMNMLNILPFLCIIYALLPRKIRTLPLSKTLVDNNTASPAEEFFWLTDPSQENSNILKDGDTNKEDNIVTLGDGYSDSTETFPSHMGLRKRENRVMDKSMKSAAPEYMLDLYRRYSRNKHGLQSSNIVRSFRNINLEDLNHIRDSKEKVDHREGSTSQVHVLTFNISSISRRERVNLAELRVFTLIERDKNTYFFGVDRLVSVLDITTDTENVVTSDGSQYQLISTRHVYGKVSDWETFDLTSTLEKWVKSGKHIHKIEIRVESLWWVFSFGVMDIKTVPNDSKEPLLLVYSNDNSKHDEHVDERHELISHELSTSGSVKTRLRHNKPSDIYLENASDRKLSRQKRSKSFRRSSICRRRPMYVDFEDINWHTWIIAPRGYQAYQCVGKCYFPISESLSPSKHAIIQSILHADFPKKAVRSCCVPTKLDPISILYIDEQGVITYKYQYDGMVVAECGCR